MTITVWQPNTFYQPGQYVTPATLGSIVSTPVANGNFAAGTGWGLPVTNWSIGAPSGYLPLSGSQVATYAAPAGDDTVLSYLRSETVEDVAPGKRLRAIGFAYLGGGFPGTMHRAAVGIEWLDSLDAIISVSRSDFIQSAPGGEFAATTAFRAWTKLDTGDVYAPANAAKARVVLIASASDLPVPDQFVSFDQISWDYAVLDGAAGLFLAVQTNSGHSAANEPTWPTTLGDTVVDGDITWEAVSTTLDSVVWEAKPILKSGATEPTWPTVAGDTVLDNTIAWEGVTRRVTDSKCPNSKVVAIASSKVFAADDDIVAFSATVNPLDWSTAEDAGYIPFGLNTYGATPVSALGLYRSNLVAFNSKGYQMWQVDEDPANHAILDASPIGCTYAKSVQPVSNDLVFLTEEGIRNITIAGASTNLQAGFFGKQIDPLVKDAIAAGAPVRSLFWPGAGQYWLFFGNEAFVLTMNGGKNDMSWSRYEFPEDIDDWTLLSDRLILRAGDKLWEVTEDELVDDIDEYGDGGVAFDGYVAWPFLDFGVLAREKQMHGFDLIVDGTVQISVGYSQIDFALATANFEIDGDTLTGQIIPMPLTGPSFQVRLTFPGDQAAPWEWQAMTVYLQDLRSTS